MNRARRLTLLAASIVAAVAAPAGGFFAAAKPPPECFGAAARDPARPCENPSLNLSATPAPDIAPLLPALGCTFTSYRSPRVCAFATHKATARATIALLGDSHAPAWRAAVDVLARGRRWRGLSLARSSGPFAFADREAPPRNIRSCLRWMRDVRGWLRRHREVHTVFLVNSVGYRFQPAGGLDAHAAAVDGYRAALDALPPSVRHIVVIRDNPQADHTTLACVGRALERRERPDRRCALQRESSLLPDPAAEAAGQLAGSRGRVIDLTRFFCDERLCYPVVGGALVFKDTSHLTLVFSRTLGPYLAADYRALRLPAA